MFRTHSFLLSSALGLAVVVLAAGSASAQHYHGGGHGHISHGHGYGHLGLHAHSLSLYGHSHYNPYGSYLYGSYPFYGYYSTGYPTYGYGLSAPAAYAPTAVTFARAQYTVAQQPPVAVTPNTARVTATFPDPDARVWIEGQPTSSLGTTRVYESPALEPGKSYFYTVRATWNQGDRTVTEERKVEVVAGKASSVDFTRPPPPERVPAPADRQPSP